MKRPAESDLVQPPKNAESKDAGNPFAGVSLFSSASSSFPTASAGGSSTGSSAPGQSANPFMGLSLFSPATSGSLFSTAVTSLHGRAADTGKAAEECSQAAQLEQSEVEAQEGGEETQDGEEVEEERDLDKEEKDGEGGDEPTGEEDEEALFRADCKLWKLVKLPASDSKEGSEAWTWQERGCGIVQINRHKRTRACRLVMRMRGVLKLLLNTPVFPTTRYEMVGQKSVRFVGVDADTHEAKSEKVPFSAFRLNLHSSDQQGKFLAILRDAADSAKS
ncbi:YRB2 [Symbiodinium microadriaticum]|nr:YRB2 [Symbiodinium microadriaticum]CAE7945425.1 YRB2 [Symbiodinium sp. KB8]